MRKVTLKSPGYDERSVAPIEAHRITIKRTSSWSYTPYEEYVFLVKVGRRVFFSQEADTDAKKPCFANAMLGIKTALRLFESALDGREVKTAQVASAYACYGDGTLTLRRDGRYIRFKAPCDAKGWMTVGEAQKIVDLLRGW